MNRVEVSGHRYGRLVVMSEAEKYVSPSGETHRQVLCKCDCGQESVVRLSSLRSGVTVTCGCRFSHGMTGTPTYLAWVNMRQRCQNPNHEHYRDYGGRGITVCQRWQSFQNFINDMGVCPDGLTLDRFPDNDGNYEPANCRWATQKDQSRNKRNNLMVTHDGVTLCVADWAAKIGISPQTLTWRLRNGWSVAEAVTTLVNQR